MARQRITNGIADVGGLNVGAGSDLKKIQSGTLTVDPANIATASTKAGTAVTLTGVRAGDIVVVEPPSALEDDLIPAGAVVTADDQVTIYLYNASAGALDGASRIWRYLWFDLT